MLASFKKSGDKGKDQERTLEVPKDEKLQNISPETFALLTKFNSLDDIHKLLSDKDKMETKIDLLKDIEKREKYSKQSDGAMLASVPPAPPKLKF